VGWDVSSWRPDAGHITDTHHYFMSESSIYRILKAHDLITSPKFTVMQAAGKFQHPTSRVHELWQTDFTFFRVVGWIWIFCRRFWTITYATSSRGA
jgi:putative transposase